MANSMHNRASGCNFSNLMLTASVAKSPAWGKPRCPKTTTVERLQIQIICGQSNR